MEDKTMHGWDNATLIARKNLTGDSAIFRIEADAPLFEFLAGQYTAIGLPADAPRIQGADPDEDANGKPRKLIVRAYSIASSSKARDYVELYVTFVLLSVDQADKLIRAALKSPPANGKNSGRSSPPKDGQ